MESRTAIRKTLAYSDIFDYPLTFEQLYQFLLTDRHYTKAVIQKDLLRVDTIVKKNDYYAFKSRKHIIARREQKKQDNEKKIEKATYIGEKIFHIPTILLIGISGGVAMLNAAKDDDIDLFIITQKNTVWITRLCILLSLTFFGMLRRRGTKQLSNTICLNMLLDETALSFAKERQDLYTAHEIVQMMPLFQRENIYMKFLKANQWILRYMPNSLGNNQGIISQKRSFLSSILLWVFSFSFLEYLSKKIQKMYMRTHITKETIASHFLAFHPRDYRKKTLMQFQEKIKVYV